MPHSYSAHILYEVWDLGLSVLSYWDVCCISIGIVIINMAGPCCNFFLRLPIVEPDDEQLDKAEVIELH